MNKKTFYLTTAIPYVNAAPHVGFALEIVQADALARYHRLLGEAVYFLTGSDENALKNVQAAEKEGIPTQELVDKYSRRFADLKKVLNLSFDDFIRTTEKRHVRGAQKLWLACRKDIYKKLYAGWYCVGCEEFKTKKDLVNGACPEHPGKKLELVKEENYFFRLSKYQKKLEELISKDKLKIIPQERKNEVLAFIRSGLEDFSISRSFKRAKGWGVPVPNDPEQIIYVWFDALINYITALGYAENGSLFKKFWLENKNILHCIGKGIIRFHAVYWPAMLLSAGLPLPTQEFVHGYVTVDGQKISKSLGNVIDPVFLVNKYGTDSIRYYLLKEITPFQDGDFNLGHFQEVYNADLANGLGNLVQRVSKLAENAKLKGPSSPSDSEGSEGKQKFRRYHQFLENYKFNEALVFIWKKITSLDKFIDQTKPWTKAGKELEEILQKAILEILEISFLLKPFLPETADKIENIFNCQKILAPKVPLFPRVEKFLNQQKMDNTHKLIIAEQIKQLGLKTGYFSYGEIKQKSADYKKIQEFIDKKINKELSRWPQGKFENHPALCEYRNLRKKLAKKGLEKIISSAEWLIQYAIKYKHLPKINPVVDLYHLVSFETLVSIGVHDQNKLKGAVIFDMTKGNETFIPLGNKNSMQIPKGVYAYMDNKAKRIICLLESKQSEETKIRKNTRNLFVILEGNKEIDSKTIALAEKKLRQYFDKFLR